MDIKFTTDEYKKLKSSGQRLFSFSELSTINECPMQYYFQYIKKIRGRDNVYSFLGGIVHNLIEKFYLEQITKEQMISTFITEFNNCQYTFDKESIKNNYFNSVLDYLERLILFKGIKFIQEELVDFPLKNISEEFSNFTFHGFIDLILYHKDGTLSIIDYKTSTKYTGEDKLKKSFQLVLYAMALESKGHKIKHIAWDFIKSCKIEFTYKSSKKTKTIKRIELSQYFGYLDLKVSHDIVKIEFTEELKNKTLEWVMSSLENIKKTKLMNESDVVCKESTDYFCKSLCSFFYICKNNT